MWLRQLDLRIYLGTDVENAAAAVPMSERTSVVETVAFLEAESSPAVSMSEGEG